jgi:hypothetical protein
VIETLAHWVLDLQSYAAERHGTEQKHLHEKCNETKLPLGTYLHMVTKMKLHAHRAKHKHDHDHEKKWAENDYSGGLLDLTIKYNSQKAYKANFVNKLREQVL